MYIDGRWVDNVVRFPVEMRARPSMEILADLAPDCRMIPLLVEALQVEELDPDLRHQVDRETAERISGMRLPKNRVARRKLLETMRDHALGEAIAASAEAKRAADDAYKACKLAIAAEQEGSRNTYAFRARANRFLNISATAALEAYRLSEIAAGQNRAIGFAILGKPWKPFDTHEATQWLIEAGGRVMAG